MKWIEITVDTTDEGAEIVCARLSMLGINEVSVVQGREAAEAFMRDSVKYWDYADDAALNNKPAVKAYLADVQENEGIVERIEESMRELAEMTDEIGVPLGSLEVKAVMVDEEDWANNWKAYFKPINVGERLTVCPTWETVEDSPDRAVLRIDPGMAFGTGTHHTTRMCLELLEDHIKGGERVADIGCGSGILSAAAILLGAKDVVAVDIDPVAARTALENAEANGIDLINYTVYTGDVNADDDIKAAFKRQRFDVVLANIVADVIIKLAPLVPQLMHEDSVFISSGIIESRLDDVTAALKEQGLKVTKVLSGADWRALEARLK